MIVVAEKGSAVSQSLAPIYQTICCNQMDACRGETEPNDIYSLSLSHAHTLRYTHTHTHTHTHTDISINVSFSQCSFTVSLVTLGWWCMDHHASECLTIEVSFWHHISSEFLIYLSAEILCISGTELSVFPLNYRADPFQGYAWNEPPWQK